MGLSPQFLDELRSRTTLSSLIGRTVKVTKAGREFKACCPFHNEKTPSFTINDEKGFYHCFGCSAHGDAIRWMTDQRGLSFMDAVKELAAEAGMDVPAADPRDARRAEIANNLHDVMAAAQDWFIAQLEGAEGGGARDYLAKRKLTTQTINEFGFGLAPDSRNALRVALKRFGDPMLIEAGLLIAIDDKEPYDRFRGRLMIPIRDARGRVIAFGGRILGDGEPKYLNSPDTPLFDKGRTLYNLDKASPASRQTGRLIVVEGYMDVVALAQAGFNDAVAPLGTALTENQLSLLWKIDDYPIVCFDGDAAGQKAAERASIRALPALKAGKGLKFAVLPPGQDPDDLIRSSGPVTFKVALDIALSMSDFLWSRQRSQIDPVKPGPDQRAVLRARLDELGSQIQDPIVSREYLTSLRSRFFEEFGFRKDSLRKAGGIIGEAVHEKLFDIRHKVLRAILLGLSRYPNVIHSRIENIAKMRIDNKRLVEMRDAIMEVAMDEPDIEQDIIEQIWLTFRNPPFAPRDLQHDLAFSFYRKHDDQTKPESDLFMLINFINREQELDAKIAGARAEMENEATEAAAAECRQYEDEKRKNRKGINDVIESGKQAA